jgi:fido (protein-threonine AMPylation protein)
MFEAVYEWAGQHRRPGELATISGFVSADPPRIEPELRLLEAQLREWVQSEVGEWYDNVGFSIVLAFQHIRFERIHPFRDGNGRVGRLLLSASLRKQFQGASPVYVDWDAHKAAYMQALREGNKGDLAPMANLLLRACGRPALPNEHYWSPYRVAPRMLEEERGTPLEEDLEWSQVQPAFWTRAHP